MNHTPSPLPRRAQLMRAAGTIIGPERLAAELGIRPRTIYSLMSGDRSVRDGILTDTRAILLRHRQMTATLLQVFRRDADA